jgi:polyhydroxyalkanoate synthesis repressor PhaR
VSELRLIKKYPNRRLYDVRLSTYITLQDIYRLLAEHIKIIVLEQPSGREITRSVLMQVLLEQEDTEAARLSDTFLRNLIRSYAATGASETAYHLEHALKMYLNSVSSPVAERLIQPRAIATRSAATS